MENLIHLHFKFDVLSLSYADFIREIADNGVPLEPERKLNSFDLSCSIRVPEELATVLKLKFGYFQVKVKTKEELEVEQLEYLKIYQEMLKKHMHEFETDSIWTTKKKDPASKTDWYEESKRKLTGKDRYNSWLDGMKF